MECRKVLLAVLLVLVVLSVGVAEVRLPSVISDNMLLQQQTKAAIWGWADPGEKVKVKGSWQWFGKSTKANENGKWMVRIKTPKAGGPYNILIEGENVIVVDNILIGEVWLCSGQSNMAMQVQKSINAEQEIAAADYPEIRVFGVRRKLVETPQEDCKGVWRVCSPDVVGQFSGVAYFFGREIHKELDVPVGLIESAWGGSEAEAWMNLKAIEANPDIRVIYDRYDETVKKYKDAMPDFGKKRTKWDRQYSKLADEGKKVPPKPRWYGPYTSGPYNGMIAPIISYTIRGAIWYQGESNVPRAHQYRKLFPALIANWRDEWGLGDFPFYYVQIAPYKYLPEHTAAELREAQMMTLSVPNTGMVVTSDIGNPNDIHPRNKIDVGKRLSLWALAKDYGKKGIVHSGPLYRSMKIEGDKVRLFFDHVGGGLVAKDGELTDFTIAAKDEKFVDAKAVIDGDTIVVSSDKIKEPASVRFAWKNTAVPNLFNKEGLPASSFRTDDWTAVTYGVLSSYPE